MMRWGAASALAIFAILLASVLAGVISPYDPDAIDLDGLRESPGIKHPFGTDQKGRDVFTRVLTGGKSSIGVAVTAACLSMAMGLLVGLISGYFGGRVDAVITAVIDFIMSFPSLLLAIGISIVLPQGAFTVMIAIAAVGWTSFARLIRGHVMKLREEPFVEAARAVGAGNGRIIFVHLLPQCLPLGFVMMGVKVGGFILTEASLSFLGLGAPPPTASWGAMISSGRDYIMSAPWMVMFPGMAIGITALSFNILGDALSERFGLRKKTASL